MHAQSCPTLCDPMDCTQPGFSAQGIPQARTVEWVAISSSRGSSRLKDQTGVSPISCIGRGILYHWCHLGSPIIAYEAYTKGFLSIWIFISNKIIHNFYILDWSKWFGSNWGERVRTRSIQLSLIWQPWRIPRYQEFWRALYHIPITPSTCTGFFIHVFIWLRWALVTGCVIFSRSMWDLSWRCTDAPAAVWAQQLWHAGSGVHGLHCSAPCGILVPQPGMNLCPPARQGRFFTTGPPGTS